MKGIILVGGKGSRLYPLTLSSHKQLLPVYDKPMIYYALSTLMEAGIKDIIVISTKEYASRYKQLLGDGSNLGINLQYTYEEKSLGIAKAFTIAEDFIKGDDVCLLLGDNIFLGDLRKEMTEAVDNCKNDKATIFGYLVEDPERFGVVEFAKDGKSVVSLEEKPQNPKSNYAQTGLYFYPRDVIEYAKKLKPSARGEYEITDINNLYLQERRLNAIPLNKNVYWLDSGTKDSLLDASIAVKKLENKEGKKYGCIEEIAYKNKWINKNELIARANQLYPSDYSKDLLNIAKNNI